MMTVERQKQKELFAKSNASHEEKQLVQQWFISYAAYGTNALPMWQGVVILLKREGLM